MNECENDKKKMIKMNENLINKIVELKTEKMEEKIRPLEMRLK